MKNAQQTRSREGWAVTTGTSGEGLRARVTNRQDEVCADVYAADVDALDWRRALAIRALREARARDGVALTDGDA